MSKTDFLSIPSVFRELVRMECLKEEDICTLDDGFCAVRRSLWEILAQRGILTVPGEKGRELECRLFFDDWYLYSVPGEEDKSCSLFKMREQEHDAKLGLHADGDIPGVTVSFIAMQTRCLLDCLNTPDEANRKRLGQEINRVVAQRGQSHSPALKAYFIRTEAQGPYLIGALYASGIAALYPDGVIPVPECYTGIYRREGAQGRLVRFIEENNRAAGSVICDHKTIRIRDPKHPTQREQLAILATHTGNVSLYSFAAEIQFHAKFLASWAKIPLPVVGRSVYASAVRADMSIGDAEMTGPTPYYRADSRLVKAQYACHKDRLQKKEGE